MVNYRDTAERWLRDAPEGGRALDAVGRLLVALKSESDANSNDSRVKAQEAAVVAYADLGAAIGARDLLRRRLIVAARDLDEGAKVDVADYDKETKAALDGSPGGLRRLRRMSARLAIDAKDALSAPLARLLAGAFLATAAGYDSLLANPVKSGGVDPKGGAANFLHQKIAYKSGYTHGAEGAGRVRETLWRRAAAEYNKSAAKLRQAGEKAPDITPETIRFWCGRHNKLKEIFDGARRDGRAARPKPKRKHLLPAA
jgi:hypothetical protein